MFGKSVNLIMDFIVEWSRQCGSDRCIKRNSVELRRIEQIACNRACLT